MATKKTVIIAVVLIIIVAGLGMYAAVTYPRTAVSFQVSFTVGAETRTEEFEVPLLHELFQVEVEIQSGSALWSAELTSGNNTVWSHSAASGSQTTYTSDWMQIPAGHYNFTFRTIGAGSLDTLIKVTTKGGFW